jgi:hypothetical protein
VTTASWRRGHRNLSSVSRFRTSTKAGPIEEQQLHPVATAIAERKNRRSKRIERHRLLDQNRKAVDASPEVDRLTVQIDLQVTAQSEHGLVLR